MIRESVFVCSCRLKNTVRLAYVRAWDADEAAEIFIRELNEEGILDPSDVHVRSVSSVRHRALVPRPGARSSISETGAIEGVTPGA
jgi:hypothetical protein